MPPHESGSSLRTSFLSFSRTQDQILVTPESASHAPFILPNIPGIHIDWLTRVSNLFWQQNERCLSFVLLLSPQARTWSVVLPRQICSAQGSTWAPQSETPFICPPGHYVAGSFQSRPIAPLPFPGTHPFPGIHFVFHPDPERLYLRACMQCSEPGEQESLLIDPADLIDDDHASLMASCQDRLTFI